jgi:hypothetical protein
MKRINGIGTLEGHVIDLTHETTKAGGYRLDGTTSGGEPERLVRCKVRDAAEVIAAELGQTVEIHARKPAPYGHGRDLRWLATTVAPSDLAETLADKQRDARQMTAPSLQ